MTHGKKPAKPTMLRVPFGRVIDSQRSSLGMQLETDTADQNEVGTWPCMASSTGIRDTYLRESARPWEGAARCCSVLGVPSAFPLFPMAQTAG